MFITYKDVFILKKFSNNDFFLGLYIILCVCIYGIFDDFLDSKGFLFTLIKYICLFIFIKINTLYYDKYFNLIIKSKIKYIILTVLLFFYIFLKFFLK